MSENCTHDCANCSENCSSREIQKEAPHPMSKIKKVIGVVSGKGGVGKSLVSSLLAIGEQRRGANAAILDADITGPSIPKVFGVTGPATGDENGLYPAVTIPGTKIMSVNLLLEDSGDPVVWRGPVIAGVVKQFWTDVIWGEVDYMFVDMPPGTGDVPLTVFQSLPVDGIIVVTSPQELVSMIVGKAVRMANMMNIPILGLVENMSYFPCPDCGKKLYPFGEGKTRALAAEYNLPLLAEIPMDPKLAALCDAGTLETFEGDWLEKALDAVEAL
ncbi:MAG: Mrp/NBP35 family ATP-binding protein [Clostridia bacterium]|nr:Mrp/NBP35 family ATP-binding protein [Clostridia bacterium]